MTDRIFDDRAAAYVGARELLKAAQKLKTGPGGELACGLANPLPPLYWGLLAEAQILANLARVDAGVGLAAGTYLVDQQERIDRNRARAQDLIRAAAGRRTRVTAEAAADANVAGHPAAWSPPK